MTLFSNRHYNVQAHQGCIVFQRTIGTNGRFFTGAEAQTWIAAFEADAADHDLCAAYCRAIMGGVPCNPQQSDV